MNGHDADFYVRELHRVTRPGALLFLTIHGRALDRALTESHILAMPAISRESAESSVAKLTSTGFSFVRQNGHLTSDSYDYGITFIGERYIGTKWSRLFSVEGIIRRNS